jgi:hypothetical protein
MDDTEVRRSPTSLSGIVADTTAMSFTMMSEARVGSLLAWASGLMLVVRRA